VDILHRPDGRAHGADGVTDTRSVRTDACADRRPVEVSDEGTDAELSRRVVVRPDLHIDGTVRHGVVV